MEIADPEKPLPPDLPKYIREPLEKQSPERLETIATYAVELAEWKRQHRQAEVECRRSEDAIDDEEIEELEERGVSTDPAEYDDVPASGAYITVKETKPSYRYFYCGYHPERVLQQTHPQVSVVSSYFMNKFR